MNLLSLFKPITTFVFDVDGVLTDGKVWLLPGAVMARNMNIKDGYALQLAVKKGYRVLVISGGDSPEVVARLQKLGVTDVFMKVSDKEKVLQDYISLHKINKNEVLAMGDDLPDLQLLKSVGLPTCSADAVIDVQTISTYISEFKGGEGCVREVIEKTMKLRGDWDAGMQIRAF